MQQNIPTMVKIRSRSQETRDLFTIYLDFMDSRIASEYTFTPGQFNMLYVHGVGEIPISIISDPDDPSLVGHTIRAVGRVSNTLSDMKVGDCLGLRGPFGRGWPVEQALGKDIIILTGGLGCAPVLSFINYIMRRRDEFGNINIVQGVKHSADLIWKVQYEKWAKIPGTTILLAADAAGPTWPWHIGRVTEMFRQMTYDPGNCIVMMCGPEGMMKASANELLKSQVRSSDIWLSMERSMKCAVGNCGHCQFGDKFICRDGPVVCLEDIQHIFDIRGF
jgi:NAD(P)H-flavin reductase